MATATLAFTRSPESPEFIYRGRQKGVTGYLAPTADDDYAAKGLAVSAATFGLSRLDEVDVHGMWADGAGTAPANEALLFEGAYYDKTEGTIQLSTSAADGDPLDESNTGSIGGYTLRVTAWGV